MSNSRKQTHVFRFRQYWCSSQQGGKPPSPLSILRKSSSLSRFLPFTEILLDGILPVLVQRCAAPDSGHGPAHHLVVEAGALAVAVVIHRPVGGDAQMARRFHRVDVGTQKEEFPAILLLLALDHLFDPLGGVAAPPCVLVPSYHSWAALAIGGHREVSRVP